MNAAYPEPPATAISPQCGGVLPVNPGYVTWCDGCDQSMQAQAISEYQSYLYS